MIDRRAFMAGAAIVALATRGRAGAQAPAARVKRIGILLEAQSIPPKPPKQFLDALALRGWIDGVNVEFARKAVGHREALPAAAREIVELRPDLILANSTQTALAVKAATRSIPVLFDIGGDPVELGLVASLARPGGNMTGFAYGFYDEKLLETLKQALPATSRVMIPVARFSTASARTAKALSIELTSFPVADAEGLDAFFQAVRRTRPDGVVVPNVAWMTFQMNRIAAQLRDARTPSIAIWRKYPAAGGLLCFGADDPMNRRVDKIDRLLRGEKPGDMPVEMPTHFHLTVNLATAETIGVRIAPDVLSRADEVIR